MDKIAIVEKHLKTFKELRPERPPKQPKEPKKPEGGVGVNTYQKRKDDWQKKVAMVWKPKFDAWERTDKRRQAMSQIQITADGLLTCGSAHRMVRMSEIENELGEDYYLNGDGTEFPPFAGILKQLPCEGQTVIPFTDIIGFRKTAETVSKGAEQVKVIIKENKMTFKPIYGKGIDMTFAEASYRLDQPVEKPIEFAINSTYLFELFKLLGQLKIQKVEMHITSPVRPIFFKAENFLYLISPLRSK